MSGNSLRQKAHEAYVKRLEYEIVETVANRTQNSSCAIELLHQMGETEVTRKDGGFVSCDGLLFTTEEYHRDALLLRLDCEKCGDYWLESVFSLEHLGQILAEKPEHVCPIIAPDIEVKPTPDARDSLARIADTLAEVVKMLSSD